MMSTFTGTGAILSKGGKAGKLGGKLLGGAKMIGRAIPGALAVGLGGAVIDSALGAAGVGKMTPEEDEKLQAQDEANWEKMTLGQKIQSGVARGIEKTGSFLFLDNMANQARKERIKSETKYLEENPNNLETKLQVNPDIDQLSRENFELRNDKEQQVSIVNAPTTINQTQQAAPSFNNGTRARPREEYSDSYTRMYMTKVLA